MLFKKYLRYLYVFVKTNLYIYMFKYSCLNFNMFKNINLMSLLTMAHIT